MYNGIEEFYKKKSPYNSIKKSLIWLFIIYTIIYILISFFNKKILLTITIILILFSIKPLIITIVKKILHIKISKKNKNEIPLIIAKMEYDIFKEYSIKNKIYNEKSLQCIINHYRNLVNPKISSVSLIAILAIVIPTLVSFYKDGNFDIDGLFITLPYIVTYSMIIILLYFSICQIIKWEKFFKGEDGMNERLEEIFSKLYIECINELISSEKIIEKKNTKKRKK